MTAAAHYSAAATTLGLASYAHAFLTHTVARGPCSISTHAQPALCALATACTAAQPVLTLWWHGCFPAFFPAAERERPERVDRWDRDRAERAELPPPVRDPVRDPAAARSSRWRPDDKREEKWGRE